MSFTGRIRDSVERELALARETEAAGDARGAFQHLERAHILGQASTRLHVRTHVAMLGWGLRHRNGREVLGQLVRLLGAAAGTAFGFVPHGNSGGANVSPFLPMDIAPDLAELIAQARQRQA